LKGLKYQAILIFNRMMIADDAGQISIAYGLGGTHTDWAWQISRAVSPDNCYWSWQATVLDYC